MNNIYTHSVQEKATSRVLKKKNDSFFNFGSKHAFFQPLQRKEANIDKPGAYAADIIAQTVDSSGQPLDRNTRSFMENRFGHDFSDVKIHTGSVAAMSALSINALAYTTGSDIVFNEGQYAPGTDHGKRLLAHELTHVIQQKEGRKAIQRACSATDQTEYDRMAGDIRQLPLYLNVPRHARAIYTPAQTRSVAEEIITQARTRDDCLYYMQYLHTLFSTPEAPASSVGQFWGPILSQAAQEEQQRLQDPQSQQDASFEEGLSGDPGRQWTPLSGQGGKIYYVDQSDLNNIVVKVKVKLTGQQQYVDQAKQLEDGIEKASSILGYAVNLEFVNRSGRDVFEANVDPTQWPTSGNWVGNVRVMAHELHHLLNLPDRYNYIESHSGNQKMFVANRIHWFREEFNRQPDPNIRVSFMGKGSLVTDEDICAVIQSANVSACVSQRQSLRSTAQGVKFRANGKVQRIIEVLSGIIPPTLLDPRASTSTLPQAQQRISRTAQLIFSTQVSNDAIETALRRIRNNLISGRVYMENTTAPRCRNEHLYFSENPLTFVICPSFTGLSAENQQKELLRIAYRMYQEISSEGRVATLMGRPMDPADAEKWARFVITAYNRI